MAAIKDSGVEETVEPVEAETAVEDSGVEEKSVVGGPLETPESPAGVPGAPVTYNGPQVYAHAPGMETPESPTPAPGE